MTNVNNIFKLRNLRAIGLRTDAMRACRFSRKGSGGKAYDNARRNRRVET